MSGTLRFTPTQADLKAAYALHIARPVTKALFWLVPIAVMLGLLVASTDREATGSDELIIIIVMLGWLVTVTLAIYFIVRFLWLPRFSKRIYAQQMDLRGEVDIVWDESGFTATNASGHANLPWADFYRWKRSETMLLLYRSEAMFNFVPLHDAAFVQAADEMVRHLQAAGVKAK